MYCHSEKKFKPAETLYISKFKKQTNKHVNIERGKTKSPQIHDVTEGVFWRVCTCFCCQTTGSNPTTITTGIKSTQFKTLTNIWHHCPVSFQAKPIYAGWLCLAPEGTDFNNPMQRSRVGQLFKKHMSVASVWSCGDFSFLSFIVRDGSGASLSCTRTAAWASLWMSWWETAQILKLQTNANIKHNTECTVSPSLCMHLHLLYVLLRSRRHL